MTSWREFVAKPKIARCALVLHAAQWAVLLVVSPDSLAGRFAFGTAAIWASCWGTYAVLKSLSLADIIKGLRTRIAINVFGVLMAAFWALSFMVRGSYPGGAITIAFIAICVLIRTGGDRA